MMLRKSYANGRVSIIAQNARGCSASGKIPIYGFAVNVGRRLSGMNERQIDMEEIRELLKGRYESGGR
jgi:hypothetical protein